MWHGSAGIYISSFPERLVSREEIDKKLDQQIREQDRKEFIDKIINKIISIFRKNKTTSPLY